MTSEEKIARLRRAAEFVKDIPPDQFDMDHWWLPEGEYWDSDRNVTHRVSVGPCGCAVGHMVQSELFELHSGVLRNERQRIFVILGDIFGVSYKTTEFMFDQYAYSLRRRVTPADVVRRIEFVISEM